MCPSVGGVLTENGFMLTGLAPWGDIVTAQSGAKGRGAGRVRLDGEGSPWGGVTGRGHRWKGSLLGRGHCWGGVTAGRDTEWVA